MLPKLTILHLDSEFAYTFRLGMLASTPSLESLHVNIWSRSQDLHKRTIHLSGLLLPKPRFKTRYPQLHISNEDKEEVEYIHASALRSFAFRPCTLDSQVMTVLFSKVIPNISALSLGASQGFRLEEWVDLTSSHWHLLESVNLTWPTPSEFDLSQVGLTNTVKTVACRLEHHLVGRPLGRALDPSAGYSFQFNHNPYTNQFTSHLPSVVRHPPLAFFGCTNNEPLKNIYMEVSGTWLWGGGGVGKNKDVCLKCWFVVAK